MVTANYDGPWSEDQRLAIAMGPTITAPLSLLGSLFIMFVLLVDKCERKNTTFRRLMFMLSTMDLLSSIGFSALYGWSVPTEPYSYGPPWAMGTTGTCELQGFMTNFFQGAMYYTASLAIYYVLVVRYRWTEKAISRYAEPLMHFVSTVWPLSTGAYALIKGYFNPMNGYPGWCWLHDFPADCIIDENLECNRGGDLKSFKAILSPFGIYGIWIVIVTCMLLMYVSVRETEQRLRRYGLGTNDSEAMKMTRRVGNQGLLFVLGYILCYTGTSLLGLYDTIGISPGKHPKWAFALGLIGSYTIALQGLVNCLVFLRVRREHLFQQGRALHFLSKFLARFKPWSACESIDQHHDADDNECPCRRNRCADQAAGINLCKEGCAAAGNEDMTEQAMSTNTISGSAPSSSCSFRFSGFSHSSCCSRLSKCWYRSELNNFQEQRREIYQEERPKEQQRQQKEQREEQEHQEERHEEQQKYQEAPLEVHQDHQGERQEEQQEHQEEGQEPQ